jgi:hypothetical protein
MHPLVREVLDKAVSQLGVEEKPKGSNDGSEVRSYLRATGLGPGNPWCAAFLAWCVQQVERKNDLDIAWPKTASCDVILTFARRHEILHTQPEVGDVFLVLASSNDATHTGFVRSVSTSKFRTVEGNSNSTGSREGYGVVSNQRPFKARYRYVRWGALLRPAGSAPDAEIPKLAYDLFLSGKDVAKMEVTNGVARIDVDTWAKKLGISRQVSWNGDDRCIEIDGRPVPATPLLKNGKVYLPIRVLAEFSGLNLEVDTKDHKVFVTRHHIT